MLVFNETYQPFHSPVDSRLEWKRTKKCNKLIKNKVTNNIIKKCNKQKTIELTSENREFLKSIGMKPK